MMASGTALGVFVLLLVLAVPAVQRARDSRADARTAICAGTLAQPAHPCGLAGFAVHDEWQGRTLTRQVIAGQGNPAPPGVARLPSAGELVLSPALEREYQAPGNELLRERLPGKPIGTIGAAGLLQPEELLAYVGVPDTAAPGQASRTILGYGPKTGTVATVPSAPDGIAGPKKDQTQRLVAIATGATILAVPVVLFIANCARLSAATRDRRLRALRLLGLTPRQAQVVNAIETGVITAIGSAVALAAFEVLRPAFASLTLGEIGWFAADLQMPTLQLASVVIAAPLLSVFVGVVAVRRVAGPPLAGRADARPRRLSTWRLAPLVAGIVLLALVKRPAHPNVPNTTMLVLMSVGLAAALIGIAIATSVVVQAVAGGLARSARPVSVLLGSRRLQAEPASASRAVTGLIVLIFIAAFAQTALSAVRASVFHAGWTSSLASNVYRAPAHTTGGRPVPQSTYSQVNGIHRVVPLVKLQSPSNNSGDNPVHVSALVISCVDLNALLLHPASGCVEHTTYRLPVLAGGDPFARAPAHVSLVNPLAPSGGDTSADIAVPTQTLQIPDPQALNGGLGANLLIPPDDPAVSAVAGEPLEYLVITDGRRDSLEALRTAVAVFDPTQTATPLDPQAGDGYHLAVYRAVVFDGTMVTLLVAFAALLVGALDRAHERRRTIAMQIAVGVPLGILRRAEALQGLIPYLTGVALATGLASVAGRAFERASDYPTGTNGNLAIIAAVALAGAAVVALSTQPTLSRSPRPALLHRE
jgi:hypothetical protein